MQMSMFMQLSRTENVLHVVDVHISLKSGVTGTSGPPLPATPFLQKSTVYSEALVTETTSPSLLTENSLALEELHQ